MPRPGSNICMADLPSYFSSDLHLSNTLFLNLRFSNHEFQLPGYAWFGSNLVFLVSVIVRSLFALYRHHYQTGPPKDTNETNTATERLAGSTLSIFRLNTLQEQKLVKGCRTPNILTRNPETHIPGIRQMSHFDDFTILLYALLGSPTRSCRSEIMILPPPVFLRSKMPILWLCFV